MHTDGLGTVAARLRRYVWAMTGCVDRLHAHDWWLEAQGEVFHFKGRFSFAQTTLAQHASAKRPQRAH